jgi:type IV pilus assembly protein PilX
MSNSNTLPMAHRQRGMVLVTALLMLVVVTLLAVSMFRSFGLDEKIAGNVREKQRALSAAEMAEEYAEWWLANGLAGTPVACAGQVLSSVGQVCTAASTATTDFTSLPWPARVKYVYAANAATTMNTTTSGPSYYSQPPFYSITFLGTTSTSNMYQIDAVGYSGSTDTAAVVEANYAISVSNTCLSCPP